MPRNDVIPSGEIISIGQHKDELDSNIAAARPDQIFTPLMVDAGILPAELRGSRMIPAVTYGIEVTRPESYGVAEILPGTDGLLSDATGTDYFNPHMSLRTRGHNLIDSLRGKGKNRLRGNDFGMPSYVLENAGVKHLFVGGNDDDVLERIGDRYAEKIAEAYELGSVVVGSNVVIGTIRVDAGNLSIPSLVREIGQTINAFDVPYNRKVSILADAKKRLSAGQSPDYRGVPTRKGWPKK